jgi:GH25 family lysozyme M1 (1,4-beta-N-acetylmuramidase)
MTEYGWDTSHFDGIITLPRAKQAKAEGIVFATAKISENANYDDPADGTNLRNFRDAGIKVLGGYHVVRTSGSTQEQVDYHLSLLDRDEPWWRDFPGFFHQVDLELWGYDNVSAAKGIEFGKLLKKESGRLTVMYASHGQYGERLRAWAPDPLWNANYPSSRRAPFKSLYPGDDFRGWDPYSGQVPTFLQYASSATIAGMTTCDANAFRGTFDELYSLITGGHDMAGTDITTENILTETWNGAIIPPVPGSDAGTAKDSAGTALQLTRNTALTIDEKVDEILAVIKASTGPVGTVTIELDTLRKLIREELDKTKLAGA